MRLTRKFVITLVLGIMFVLSANAVTRVQREVAFFDRDARHDATLVGAVIAAAMDHVWRTEGETAALSLLGDVVQRSRHYKIRFVWLDERSRGDFKPELPLSELASVLQGHPWTQRIESGDGVTYTYVPANVPIDRLGAIEIRESLLDERRYIRATWRNTIVATLGVIAVCAALVSVIGLIFVGRPTRALVGKVRRIGSGDLSGPLPARQKDELGEIASEVNAMCERLAEAQVKLQKETEERIAAEQQLRHADRLMTVGKLASGMAHELGTPLNVVSGRAQMIASGESVDLEAKEDARIIIEQTRRMTKLMRELLDFARPRPAQRAWVDLRPLAQQTLTLLSALARSHEAELLVLDGESAWASIDPGQLQQVLTNLVVNAIHALPGHGTVSIGFRHEHAKAPFEHGGRLSKRLVVEVSDTGQGMDAAIIPRIFEPFFTTKEVGQGTGLGLSVTHGIVREHGGFITVHSEPGEGTTFAVHLPLDLTEEEKA
ncbi:MAG TPA: HAMP domain-containing sensor histidine kinase [Polyangiales bacterium]|nr:HAMP domain-containing sensor histidine kinase [Polyangiales bacterium]